MKPSWRRAVALVAPLVLLGACFAPGPAPEEAGDPAERALRLEARARLDAGAPEQALALLDEALEGGAAELRTLRLRQDVLIALGREEEARAEAAAALERASGGRVEGRAARRADAMVLLARLSNDAEAEDLLRSALEVAPEHAFAAYGLGVLAARRRDLARAEERFGEALDASPSFEEARLRRAQVRDRLADFEGAADDYRAYVELAPDDVDALYDYASLVHRELFRPSEAEDLYRKLLERAPGHVDATVGLAVCLEERGRYEEAERLYLSVWNRAPYALFNLGMLYQDRLERYAEARECFRRFLALEPGPDGPAVSIADRLVYAPLRLEELNRRLAREQIEESEDDG